MVGNPALVCRCNEGANNYRLHWNPECPFYVSPENARTDKFREALITIADRLEDEGCQCDASDEYVYKCNLCIANGVLEGK